MKKLDLYREWLLSEAQGKEFESHEQIANKFKEWLLDNYQWTINEERQELWIKATRQGKTERSFYSWLDSKESPFILFENCYYLPRENR